VLSLTVGIRLVASRGEGPRPERLLSLYFLLGAFVGNITSSVAYLGWSDPSLGIPIATTTLLNAICLLGATLGASGVYLFTARTFHGAGDPYERAAGAGAWLAIALMLSSYAAQAAFEGFAIRVVAGPIHWIGFSLRALAFACAGAESLRYYAVSKKRMRLGLSEPIVTNRFLLWGVWSIATGLLVSSELIARVLYLVTTGDAAESVEAVATVAQPLIVITVTITAVLGSISVSLLFLTFFPTRRFRSWLERSWVHAS
jgi:hypothetical protein